MGLRVLDSGGKCSLCHEPVVASTEAQVKLWGLQRRARVTIPPPDIPPMPILVVMLNFCSCWSSDTIPSISSVILEMTW